MFPFRCKLFPCIRNRQSCHKCSYMRCRKMCASRPSAANRGWQHEYTSSVCKIKLVALRQSKKNVQFASSVHALHVGVAAGVAAEFVKRQATTLKKKLNCYLYMYKTPTYAQKPKGVRSALHMAKRLPAYALAQWVSRQLPHETA